MCVRQELERPWLSYLEGGERPGGGDPEETEEQARNRKGLDLIARLDGILAEKTKEAKRCAPCGGGPRVYVQIAEQCGMGWGLYRALLCIQY